MQKNISHKEIVLEFWRKAIGQGDLDLTEKLVSDNYIQHSAAGKPGKSGLLNALRMLKQLPKPNPQPKPFMRVVAEGEYVALHMLIEFAGKKMVVLDLVRIEDGLFAEHWDAVQMISELHSDFIIDGPVDI